MKMVPGKNQQRKTITVNQDLLCLHPASPIEHEQKRFAMLGIKVDQFF